jgi:uncharacterized protein
MRVYVYRSSRRRDTYVYLARKDAFEMIPEPLMQVFGTPCLALEFDLTPGRTLAQEDPEAVRVSLRERGFHLQMPADNERPQ